MFYPKNFIIPFLVLAPNIVFFLACKVEIPNIQHNKLLSFCEVVGRFGVMIITLFNPIRVKGTLDIISVVGMLICLIIYYGGWIRFFKNNRGEIYLFDSHLGLPVPMALIPTVFFVLSSVILRSPYLFFITVLFGIGHITNSIKIFNQLKTKTNN